MYPFVSPHHIRIAALAMVKMVTCSMNSHRSLCSTLQQLDTTWAHTPAKGHVQSLSRSQNARHVAVKEDSKDKQQVLRRWAPAMYSGNIGKSH